MDRGGVLERGAEAEGGASRIRLLEGEVGGEFYDPHEAGLVSGRRGCRIAFPINMSLFSCRRAKPEVPMKSALKFRDRAGTMWELF